MTNTVTKPAERRSSPPLTIRFLPPTFGIHDQNQTSRKTSFASVHDLHHRCTKHPPIRTHHGTLEYLSRDHTVHVIGVAARLRRHQGIVQWFKTTISGHRLPLNRSTSNSVCKETVYVQCNGIPLPVQHGTYRTFRS
jgi:hypothetical protein